MRKNDHFDNNTHFDNNIVSCKFVNRFKFVGQNENFLSLFICRMCCFNFRVSFLTIVIKSIIKENFLNYRGDINGASIRPPPTM